MTEFEARQIALLERIILQQVEQTRLLNAIAHAHHGVVASSAQYNADFAATFAHAEFFRAKPEDIAPFPAGESGRPA